MIRAYAKAGKKPLLGFKEIATSQSLPRLASLALALLLSAQRMRATVQRGKGCLHGTGFDGIAQWRWSACR